MIAKLVVSHGSTNVREVHLQPSTTVGRRKECDLCISSPLVSRDHCVIFERDNDVIVKDLGSTNGTYVNGVAIHEQALRHGDEVTIGPVSFLVQYVAAAPKTPGLPTTAPDREPQIGPKARGTLPDASPARRPGRQAAPALPETVHQAAGAYSVVEPQEDREDIPVAAVLEADDEAIPLAEVVQEPPAGGAATAAPRPASSGASPAAEDDSDDDELARFLTRLSGDT